MTNPPDPRPADIVHEPPPNLGEAPEVRDAYDALTGTNGRRPS